MQRPTTPHLIVLVQFICFAGLIVTGPVIARHPACLAVELGAVGLGCWAAVSMGRRQIRVGPGVAPHATLVTRGPYRVIRHPMYTAVLTATLAITCSHFTWVRLGIWLVLTIDLLLKLRVEEALLSARFPEYSAYRQRTQRLIPFVY